MQGNLWLGGGVHEKSLCRVFHSSVKQETVLPGQGGIPTNGRGFFDGFAPINGYLFCIEQAGHTDQNLQMSTYASLEQCTFASDRKVCKLPHALILTKIEKGTVHKYKYCTAMHT